MFKKRGILAAVVILCMVALAVPAMADVLYTTSDPVTWANDRFGIITGTSAPTKDVVTNLGGASGSGVFPFYNAAGARRVAVSQYSRSAGSDTIWIYNPATTDWSKPLKELTGQLLNIRGMVANGQYLYGIDYDKAKVARFDTTDDAFTANGTYTYAKTFNEGTPHGEAIVAYGDHIYALFTEDKNGDYTTYKANKLVKFDKDLKVVASMDLNGKNTDGGTIGSVVLNGSTLYVVSEGGSQPYGSFNDDSQIEAVDLDTMTSTTIVKASDLHAADSTWQYNVRAISIVSASEVYVHAAYWDGAYTTNIIRLYKTTLADLTNKKIGTMIQEFTGNGYSLGLEYDATTSLLWAAMGNDLRKFDGTAWTAYDSTALGGNISKFAALLAAKKGTIDFTSKDIAVKDDKGAVVSIDSVTVSGNTADFKPADVEGYTATPMSKIVISLDSSVLSDEQAVTFTIANCNLEMGDGELKVFLKARGAEKYTTFDATYDKAKKALTFTVTEAKKYFSENTLYIASAVKKTTPVNPDNGGSSGGCSAGFAGLALLAFAPLAFYRRKK